MDAKQELLASPPKTIEEVDAWLANYLAIIDATRAEAVRDERLRDAAPDLLAALVDAIESEGFDVAGPTDVRAAESDEPAWICNARAAIAKAAAAPSMPHVE